MGEGPLPGVFFAAGENGSGYRLSVQGIRTLQSFLREHGADCVRQFMQVLVQPENIKKIDDVSMEEDEYLHNYVYIIK